MIASMPSPLSSSSPDRRGCAAAVALSLLSVVVAAYLAPG
jgi:hypothetical protein